MEYIAHSIILRSQDSKDTDRMYYVFSLENGLIKAIAKSIKKSDSKLSGFLILSNQVVLMLANGKSLISRIAQVKVLKTYFHIVNDYESFLLFNQTAEVLLSFLRENSEEKNVYNLTLSFLDDLNNKNLDLTKKKKLQLVYFSELLKEFGFKPKNIELGGVLKKFLNLVFNDDYLKNRDLMLKLSIRKYDFLVLRSWFRDYFQNILEKKLNSF